VVSAARRLQALLLAPEVCQVCVRARGVCVAAMRA